MTPPLMIFAAGFGTRMGALTKTQPKPMISVAGKPLIDHALDVARGAGIAQIVVNLHYLGEQIAQHLQGQDITFSWEKDAILETGGGLKAALPLLGEGPVLLLNSDAVWAGPNPLLQLLSQWDSTRMDALLLLAPRERTVGHSGTGGFLVAPDGRIARPMSADAPIYLGAQILNPAAVATWPESVFSLGRIWDHYIAQDRAFATIYSGNWCDVGNPEGIALAERMLDV